jgi:hypothetical protein
MQHKRETNIPFIVEYEDGRTAQITIDGWTLLPGDHVARFVAEEWQRVGRIPEGKISQIRRARPGTDLSRGCSPQQERP